MADILADSLFIPFAVLAVLAWVVPKLLSLVFDEGIAPLLLLTFVATVILFVASGLMFIALYIAQGVPVADLLDGGVTMNVVVFGRLALSAVIIWAPIMVLSVANLPRNWVRETW